MANTKDVDDVIRETFYDHGVQPENSIWVVVRDVGMRIAEREIRERWSAISPFVRIAQELVEGLDLGPYDEVISVAIKGPGGEIRVVTIGSRE